MTSYTYRFIDKDNKVVYVGKSTNIDARIGQHFGGNGHLSNECYKSVCKIEYQKHKTESDSLVYETYYITLYDPKFNKMQKSRDIPTIQLEEKEWKLYREIRPTREPIQLKNLWILKLGTLAMVIYTILRALNLI